MFKSVLHWLLLSFPLTIYSQSVPGTYLLQWKIPPGDTIRYEMVTRDSVLQKTSKDNPFNSPDSASLNKASAFLNLMQEAKKKTKMNCLLSQKRNGNTSVIITRSAIKDSTTNDSLQRMIDFITFSQIGFRGELLNTGSIASFYLKREQMNILAMAFELPGKPVKIGDQWSVNTNFISMDQTFICDSSYRKNIVTLNKVEKQNGKEIAHLSYDIEEYITGTMSDLYKSISNLFSLSGGTIGAGSDSLTMLKVTYTGNAVFSITEGRWLSYETKTRYTATGFMLQVGNHETITTLSPRN